MKAYLIHAIYLFFTIIIWIMIVRILLTWFPNINWYNQPFKAMKETGKIVTYDFTKPAVSMVAESRAEYGKKED